MEGADGGATLSENSGLDRDSETPSEVGADGGSDLRSVSRPEVPSEVTPSLPSPKNLSVTQKTHIDPELASSRELETNLPSKGNNITDKSTEHDLLNRQYVKGKLIDRCYTFRMSQLILDRILIMVIPVFLIIS